MAIKPKLITPFAITPFVDAPVKPVATVFEMLYELIGSLSSSKFNTLIEMAPSEHTGAAIVSDTTGSGLIDTVMVYGVPTHEPLNGVTV